MTINKEILKEQIIVCNNSNPEFISENKKIFSEASKQFKFGNYKDTITILKILRMIFPVLRFLIILTEQLKIITLVSLLEQLLDLLIQEQEFLQFYF